MLKQIGYSITLIFWISVSAWSQVGLLERTVELERTAGTIEEYLDDLSTEAGLSIAYANNLELQRRVSLERKSRSLAMLLEELLKGSDITYKATKRKILIYPLAKNLGQPYTISGFVRDNDTGETLIGASIYDPEARKGTITNVHGFFSFTINEGGSKRLKVNYLGYEETEIVVSAQSRDLRVVLKPSLNQLAEVVVSEKRIEETQMSTVTVEPRDVQKMPAYFGEPDVVKALTLMPGIKSGNDNSGGFYVRGGGPDQNLILLDGANVYNATHAFDLFSTFNSSAIKHVELIKGGFPARYGGRLSSVMDVRMKEGNSQKWTGEVGLGYLLSKFTLEGPIAKGKTSFLISGRRTFLDLFSGIISEAASSDTEKLKQRIVFGDLSAKINHRFSEKDQIFISSYTSGDLVDVQEERRLNQGGPSVTEDMNVKLKWSNQIFSTRWNHTFNSKLFLNTIGTYTNFDIGIDVEIIESSELQNQRNQSDYVNRFSSSIEDLGLRFQFDYFPHSKHSVKFGVEGTHHQFAPGVGEVRLESTTAVNNVDTTFNEQRISSVEWAAFAEDEIVFTDKVKANIGLRAAFLDVEEEVYASLQPRFSMVYLPNSQTSINLSYARMNQFIHLLTNGSLGIPLDLWVPATPDAPPIRSEQIALGFNRDFGKGRYTASVETYYKEMNDLIAYQEGVDFTDASIPYQEKVVNDGFGRSYGSEFFLRKNTGKTTGWIGYTLSWATRQFDELNDGESYPFKYDRRHDASLVVLHELKPNITFSGTWVFATGNSVTFPESSHQRLPWIPGSPGTSFSHGNDLLNVVGDLNNVQLPSYHRLDVGISFKKQKKKGIRTWNISVYNAYIRKNAFFVYVTEGVNNNPGFNRATQGVPRILKQSTSLLIVPSVSYHFKFN